MFPDLEGHVLLTGGLLSLQTGGHVLLTGGVLSLQIEGHVLLTGGVLILQTGGHVLLTRGVLSLQTGHVLLTRGVLSLQTGHVLLTVGVLSLQTGHVLLTGGVLKSSDRRTCPSNQLKISLEMSSMNTSVAVKNKVIMIDRLLKIRKIYITFSSCLCTLIIDDCIPSIYID